MKKYFRFIPLFLLASCSSELVDMENNHSESNLDKVILQSHPFEWDNDTRTSLSATDSKIMFTWADGDAIGVFPIKPTTNSQAKQILRVAPNTDAHFASFDGAGWDLKNGNSYAAYSPYNGTLASETSYKEVPIDLTGQDGTLETIGKKYDYMYAPSSGRIETAVDGTRQIVFDFQHSISILQLKLTMPVAAKWERVSLYGSTSDFFVSSATMNAATGEIEPSTQYSSLNLNLNKVSTSSADETLTLYVAMLPTATGDLTIEAETTEHKLYVATCQSKTLVAGKAYRLSASLSASVYPCDGYENGYGYVDLGLPSGLKWAVMNVGANTPYDNGKYYAWGETKGYGEEDVTNLINYNFKDKTSYVKKRYSWETYKWCKGDLNSITKYNLYSDLENVYDGKTVLEADDDAASQNWGGKWRMPTAIELQELLDNCYWVWTDNYNGTNCKGYIVYKILSSVDKGQIKCRIDTPSALYSLTNPHIFIPVCGYRTGSWSRFTYERYGGAWSSSLYIDGRSFRSVQLSLTDFNDCIDKMIYIEELDRCIGSTIRAVCE